MLPCASEFRSFFTSPAAEIISERTLYCAISFRTNAKIEAETMGDRFDGAVVPTASTSFLNLEPGDGSDSIRCAQRVRALSRRFS